MSREVEVRVTPLYGAWTEEQLYREISERGLAHGVQPWSFPVESERLARLREILRENDRFNERRPS